MQQLILLCTLQTWRASDVGESITKYTHTLGALMETMVQHGTETHIRIHTT